jgi:two-component system heavy metal sensor histidine kinase CusS
MKIDTSRHSLSIGARLTLLYTAFALTAMALFAIVANWQLSSNFDAEHLRFLQAKVTELQVDLRDGNGEPEVLLGEIGTETNEGRLRQYQARVMSGDGRVLGETTGMQRILPGAFFPPAGSVPVLGTHKLQAADHVYALTTVLLQASNAARPLELQIAVDITRDSNLLSDFRRAMWLAFVLLAPLLAVAGRWASARGLAPLKRIVGAAREVTPTRLSARLPTTPPWPSELDELVQVFNAMLTRLEEAFARLSRFSADLAHELRTPLSNMSGELEVCLMRERSAPDYRRALESNLEECRELSVLIENLLFMARAEHAGQALRCECFDAMQACAWVVAQHAPGAAARDIRIRLDGEATMVADPLLLRQALANLLSNAIRHSHDGGEVRITLQEVHDGVEIRVNDDGEGIEAPHLAHLFDRFYQVDAARRRGVGQGTGLGLSIVKTIIALHRGTVRVESGRGRGTSVTMHVPSCSDGPAPQACSYDTTGAPPA